MAAQQGKACSLAKLAASRLNPGDPVVPKALLGTDGHTGPGVSTVGHGPNSPPSTTRRWETLPFAPPGRPGSPTALGWQLQLARDSKGTSLGSAGGPCGPPWLWPGAGASRGQTCAKPFDGHGLTQSGGPGARPCQEQPLHGQDTLLPERRLRSAHLVPSGGWPPTPLAHGTRRF